jgi:leucyl-tRNA synthetase
MAGLIKMQKQIKEKAEKSEKMKNAEQYEIAEKILKILSNIMAPFFPQYSRNVLWICIKKEAVLDASAA